MGILDILKKNKKDGEEPIEQYVTSDNYGVQRSSTDFQFEIEDVFTITGRGTVVTGHVLTGVIAIGETVKLPDGTLSRVEGIEMFRKTLDYAEAGDNAGILLGGISREQVSSGMFLTK